MFTVTESAAAAIRELITNTDTPDGGGLRIATDRAADSLRLALTAAPETDDTVFDADGAKIFLGGGAAEILDGNVIDAVTDGGGRVQFVLGPEPDESSTSASD